MNRAKIEAANTALFTDRRLEAAAEFFAPDYTVHLTDGATTGGPDIVRQFLSAILRAFPVLEVEIEILAEQGDRISWQRTFCGVQQGAFQGFPGCDRDIVWRDMVTSRFDAGLIAEEWVVSDLAERLLRARKKN